MAFVALGLSLVSGVFSAMGAMQQANAQAAQANYQAQVAAQQKIIADQQASYETAKGETQAQQQGLEAKAKVGAVVAQEGASGLDVASGSPAAVKDSAFRLGTYNEQLVRADAERRAYDYKIQGWTAEQQSKLYSMEAESAKSGGQLAAIGSLLGSAGSVAGKWYQYGGAGGGTLGA